MAQNLGTGSDQIGRSATRISQTRFASFPFSFVTPLLRAVVIRNTFVVNYAVALSHVRAPGVILVHGKVRWSPGFVNLRESLRGEGWKGRINSSISDLGQEKFDTGQGKVEPDNISKESLSNSAFDESADSTIGLVGAEGPPNVEGDEIPGDEEDGKENVGGKSTTVGFED